MSPWLRDACWLAPSVAAILFLLRAALQRSQGREAWSAAWVFLATAAVYVLSSLTTMRGPLSESYFPHYTRLAEAFLHGRLYLLEPVFEVARHGGRIYVMEPLAPAIFMAPFVALWGPAFSDVLFLILIGALNAALVFSLWPKVPTGNQDAWSLSARYWLTVLFAFGMPHWYVAVSGRVWHIEGVVALGCLLIAVHQALEARAVMAHAWLGLAFLSHGPTAFSIPFIWIVLIHRLRERGAPFRQIVRRLAAGAAVLGLEIAVGWAWYNFARFGSIFETGMTQEYLEDVRIGYSQPHGFLSVRHMLSNAWIALARPFHLDVDGFSLFWATPALLYLFWARRPGWLVGACWAGLLPVLGCLLMYHHHGATQFGYRWVLDVLPFTLILAGLGLSACRWRFARPLILASVVVNFTGLLWFYAFH